MNEQTPRRHITSSRLNPRRGWREASTVRRTLALSAPLILLVILLLGNEAFEQFEASETGDFHDPSGWLTLLSLLLAPALWSLARILRPDTDAKSSDRIRHWLAAAAAAGGLPAILLLTLQTIQYGYASALFDYYLYVGVPALLLALATLTWGLGAGLKRILTR